MMSSAEKEAGVIHTSVFSLFHSFSAYLHLMPCLTLCQADVAVWCLGLVWLWGFFVVVCFWGDFCFVLGFFLEEMEM